MFRYYFMTLLCLLVYLYGFFPVLITYKTPTENAVKAPQLHPHTNKLVLIVIDALRYDFATPELMPQAINLSKQTGCLTKIRVETPTVTLPRIKALTTGNIAQFVDIIYNLIDPAILEDSFIHRAVAGNKKIVFYGDETWVHLFPAIFARSEGTNSFFVNDFYQVDDNVTRNVERELEKSDWDIMILHYLGLDHIGHVYGPKSSLIAAKLHEMDDVIAKISERLTRKEEKFAILVTGDHGMRDSGGHGGSTPPEVAVPLLTVGLPCLSSRFAQIDIAANLAVLLGTEIPSTSIGALNRHFLSSLTPKQYLTALKYNAIHLKDKLDICGDDFEEASRLHDLFKKNSSRIDFGDLAANLFEKCSFSISEKLQKSKVKQNMGALIVSILVAAIVLLQIIPAYSTNKAHLSIFEQSTLIGALLVQFYEVCVEINVFLILTVFLILIKNVFLIKWSKRNISSIFLLLFMQPFSFFSSSYIEEEHEFWYLAFGTYYLFLFVNNSSFSSLIVLIAFRFLKILNQVGDKHSSMPDLTDWLMHEDNKIYLRLFFALGLLLSLFSCTKFVKNQVISNLLLDSSILVLIYLFRCDESVFMARIIWFLILVKLVVSIFSNISLISVFILTLNLLLKPSNTILIPFCIFASLVLQKAVKLHPELIMLHWGLGNTLFFLQGHDNSLASVDISSGYIGLESYQPLFVIPQVICHTFAMPALSHVLLFNTLCNSNSIKRSFLLYLLFRLNILIVVFVVTLTQRHHLFIWTVFAPKLFVEASHFAFLFCEACIYLFCTFCNKNELF